MIVWTAARGKKVEGPRQRSIWYPPRHCGHELHQHRRAEGGELAGREADRLNAPPAQAPDQIGGLRFVHAAEDLRWFLGQPLLHRQLVQARGVGDDR